MYWKCVPRAMIHLCLGHFLYRVRLWINNTGCSLAFLSSFLPPRYYLHPKVQVSLHLFTFLSLFVSHLHFSKNQFRVGNIIVLCSSVLCHSLRPYLYLPNWMRCCVVFGIICNLAVKEPIGQCSFLYSFCTIICWCSISVALPHECRH